MLWRSLSKCLLYIDRFGGSTTSPVLGPPLSEEMLPNVQSKPPLQQLETFPTRPGSQGEDPSTALSTSIFQYWEVDFYFFLMLKVKIHIEINEYCSIYFSWTVEIHSILRSRLLFKAKQIINCSFPSGLRTNLYHLLFPYIARITLYCFFSFGSGVVLRIMVMSVKLKALYITKAYCIDRDEE